MSAPHPGAAWHRRMLFGTVSRPAMMLAHAISAQVGRLPCDIRFADRDAANRYRASVNQPPVSEPAVPEPPVSDPASPGDRSGEAREGEDG